MRSSRTVPDLARRRMVRPPHRRKDDPRIQSLIELRRRTKDKGGQALLTEAIWAARKARRKR
eukprot:1960534-Alexandrium_andersonii.AAC.1